MELKFKLNLTLDSLAYILLITFFVLMIPNIFKESIWPDEAFYLWGASHPLSQSGLDVIFSTQTFFFVFLLIFFKSNLLTILFYIVGLLYIYKIGRLTKNSLLGLFSMLILSTSPIFYFISTRILVDVPITTMFIISSYYFLNFEKKRSKQSTLKLAISLSLTILTKSTGILFLAIIFIYYLVTYKKKIFILLKDKYIRLLILYILPVLVFTFFNLFYLLSTNSSAIKGTIFKGDFTYYITNLASHFSIYFLPILFFGLIFGFLNLKNKKYLFFMIWFLVYFSIFSFFIGEKVPRYILPALPPIIILSVNAFLFMFKDKKIQLLFSIFLVFIFFVNLVSSRDLILSKENTYVGFKDIGNYMKSINANLADRIFCGSTRAMRYYSDIDYLQYGGKIQTIPKNKTYFENLILNKSVFLETDIWEYTQPSWIYPLSKDKLDYIESLGFKPVSISYVNINNQKVPSVILFFKG